MVEWFRWIFNKQGMSKDSKRVETIMNWPTPQDIKVVRSFLQTVQFRQPLLKPENGRSYADVTHLL